MPTPTITAIASNRVARTGSASSFGRRSRRPAGLASRMPDGFVFYRNAASLYTTTELSVQSILTSRAVPDGVDALSFRAQQMRKSLPVVLHDRGFDSQLATIASITRIAMFLRMFSSA